MTAHAANGHFAVNSKQTAGPSSGDSLEPVSQHLSTLGSRAEWAHQQLTALLSDIQTMRAALSQARDQNQRVFAANRALSDRVRKLQNELRTVRAEQQQQEEINIELHDIASQALDAHSIMEGELNMERARCAQFRSAIADLEAEIDRLQAQAAGQARSSKLADELAFERSQNEQLRAAMRELEAEIDRVQEEKTSGSGINPELAQLRAQLEAEREKNAELEQRLVKAAEQRVQNAVAGTSAHKLLPKGEAGTSGISDAAMVRMRTVVADLEEALDATEAEKAQLENEVKRLRAKLLRR